MSERRGELLRLSRLRDKLRTDILDACGRQVVTILESMANSAQLVDGLVDQVTQDGRATGKYDVEGAAKALCAQVSRVTGGNPSGGENMVTADMCQACRAHLLVCQCQLREERDRLQAALSDRILSDEYALLALADAQMHKAEVDTRKYMRNVHARQYANDLQAQAEFRRKEENQQALRKQQELASERANHAQWKHEQEMQATVCKEERRTRLDELDNFCAAQRNALEARRRQDLDDERRMQEAEQRKTKEAREEEERQRRQVLDEAERTRIALEQQLRLKEEQARSEMLEDRRYIQAAKEEVERRERQRMAERMAISEKQDRIMNTVGTTITMVEEEKRKQLEESFARREEENRRKLAERDQRDAELRARMAQGLREGRQVQLRAKEYSRLAAEDSEQAFFDDMQRKLIMDTQAEKERQQRHNEERDRLRLQLLEQIEEERRNRKSRDQIGMNDVERKLNRRHLEGVHTLLTTGGVGCPNCVSQSHCSCSSTQAILSSMAAHAPARSARIPAFAHTQRVVRGFT